MRPIFTPLLSLSKKNNNTKNKIHNILKKRVKLMSNNYPILLVKIYLISLYKFKTNEKENFSIYIIPIYSFY